MKQLIAIYVTLTAIILGITGCDTRKYPYLESKVSLARWDDLAPHFNLDPYYIEIKGLSNVKPLRIALSVHQNGEVIYRRHLGYITTGKITEKSPYRIDSETTVFLEQKDSEIIGSWRTYAYDLNGFSGERGTINIPKDKLRLKGRNGFTTLKANLKELEGEKGSPLLILYFEDLKLPPSFGLETVFLNNPEATLLVIGIESGNVTF